MICNVVRLIVMWLIITHPPWYCVSHKVVMWLIILHPPWYCVSHTLLDCTCDECLALLVISPIPLTYPVKLTGPKGYVYDSRAVPSFAVVLLVLCMALTYSPYIVCVQFLFRQLNGICSFWSKENRGATSEFLDLDRGICDINISCLS